MITLVVWILFGALVGWLASIVMLRNGSMGALANVALGIIGAALGGFLFDRDVTPSVFSLGSILTALVGAVLMLAIVNLATRGRVR